MVKKQLNLELKSIKERNKRVEADKAWETSVFRRGVIAIITYIVVSLFLWSINISAPMLNSLVPTGGYILSTLSLPILKKWWVKRMMKQ